MKRFWNKVKIREPDECWEWIGSKTKGYGKIKINGKYFRAHRISYKLHYGPIPEGLLVLHRCDNKECVNPEHLELGDHKKNGQDAYDRGLMENARESAKITAKILGKRHGRKNGIKSRKLTEKEVKEIFRLRKEGLTLEKIAEYFPVTHRSISKILNRKTYKEVKIK